MAGLRRRLGKAEVARRVAVNAPPSPASSLRSTAALPDERRGGRAISGPERVRERLWVWAHPEGSYDGPQWGLPENSRVTPLESAVWLGVPNVILIHYGDLPRWPLAQYARPLEAAGSVMWSIVGGGGETTAAMRESVMDLARSMPNLTGLFMDDFFHFRGTPPAQWLAAPGVEFPVTVDVTLAEPVVASSVELVQSAWVGGDHRSGEVFVEVVGPGGERRHGTEVTMPDEPGAAVSVEIPETEVGGVRVSILGTHDRGGARSCGLCAIRLRHDGELRALDGATVEVGSRYPAAGRTIEERMAVTDGRAGADWADPALMPPEVLIDRDPPVAASLTPPELAEVRRALGALERSLELGVAIYDYQLDVPSISQHLELVDLVILWHWSPQDLPRLPGNLERLRRLAPSKRTMIGLYMWDFGTGGEIPLDTHRQACEQVLELLRGGAVDGIVFLAGNICDLDIPAVEWTRRWITEHGDSNLD
jgi:hypothetical protein